MDDKFLDLTIIPLTTADIECMHAIIDPLLDLSLIHRLQKYDKFGPSDIIGEISVLFFGCLKGGPYLLYDQREG